MFSKSFFALLLGYLSLSSVKAAEGYLGISARNHAIADVSAPMVVNVYDDGAAWTYGILENDLITRINGKDIQSVSDIDAALSGKKWGDRLTVRVVRNERALEIPVVLGYSARSKTYELLKSEQLNGEVHWYFDDNTTIVMRGEHPVSVTKKDAAGQKSTLPLTSAADWDALPQNFMDLKDKLEVIAYALAEQKTKGVDADRITFIKEVTPMGTEEVATNRMAVTLTEVNVFPNPSNGAFQLNINASATGTLEWAIYDVRGTNISGGAIETFDGSFQETIDLANKYSGVFLLVVQIGEDRLTRQLILQ